MLNLLLSFLFLLGNPKKNATVLGATQTVYTDSLPPSPTCTYYVAGDITLQGNFDLRGITFLLKSDFRRNYTLDKQTNNRIKQTNGVVFGTNIRLCKARVNLNNCTFAAADSGMWGGVYLADSSSQLRLFQSNIQDSYNGIVQTDSSQIVADQSHFLNNYVSLQLAGNRDTIRYCSFNAKPKTMKMPFDSVAATDYYYSFAHVKNATNKEIYLHGKQFFLNLFLNALYGVCVDKKHHLRIEESHFYSHQLAAIYHQNGDLQVINQNEIHLPTTYKNTLQMQTERGKNNLTTEGGLNAPSFGIYATDGCNDLVAQQTSIRSHKNQPTVAAPDSLPFNHIGYFGRGVNVTFSENSAKGNFINGVWFMKHGIQLIGAGDYSIRATGFINNKKAIVFGTDEGSPATLLGKDKFGNGTNLLSIRCNEFVRQQSGTSPVTHNIRNVQCIGISVEGAINIEEIGNLQNPNGNEVRTSLNLCTAFNQNGQCTQAPTSTLLDFFRAPNLVSTNITYHCYNQENIDYYQDYSFKVYRGNKNATDTTCFASMGVLNRMGNTNVGTTSTKVFLDSRLVLLEQNYPNPALHGSTEIKYSFPSNAEGMNLVVYDLRSGRKMAEQPLMQAEGIVSLDTKGWATGIYSYCLVQQGRVITAKKMAVGQ